MSIYPCKSRGKPYWSYRASMFLAMLILALSVQARTSAQIEDHYFGATLFVAQTGARTTNAIYP